MQTFLQRNRVFLLHLTFWCVYLSFNLYQITVFQRDRGYDWGKLLTSVSLQLIFTMLIAYLNYFVMLPRFLKHKKLWRYLIEFSVPFALLTAFRIYLHRYLMDGFTHKIEHFYSIFFVIQIAAVSLLIVIFVGMLRFAVAWFELDSKKREMENEKLTAELKFLKAQINPHFLFNTLNNLYYLAYSQSPNTTEVIAKLSQMMRYMIYDTNHPRVLLNKEIEYMQSYISLERLRLNDQIPVEVNVTGRTDDVWISPLIFITFLENAFKHGVSNTNKNSWIKVGIHLNGNHCLYTVENGKPAGVMADNNGKSGIGLQNVQRRLALSYPDRYELNVHETADRYAVTLNLELT